MTARPARRVRALLRAEAERHRPDVDRVRARFEAHLAAEPAPRGRRWGRAGAPLVAAVAAGSVALAAVAGAEVLGDPDPAPPATAAAGPPTSGPVTPTATGARTTAPAPTLPPLATTPVPRTPSPTLSPSPPPATGPAVLPRLELRQVPRGQRLALGPGGGDLDWLVFGRRPDGAVVRAASPRAPLPAPVVVAGTPGAPGPYATSWTGGTPDPAGPAGAGWLALEPGRGSVRLEVPASAARRQLLVHVGTAGADCEVRAGVPGRTATVTLNAPAVAAVATVTIEPGSGPVVVEVVGLARSAGGRFGVAAVELR